MIHTSVGEIKESTSSKINSIWPPNTEGTKGWTVKGIINDVHNIITITIKMRNHTVQDNQNKYHRYIALVVDVEFVRKRTFGPDGKETEIQTLDKASTKGHLNQVHLVTS